MPALLDALATLLDAGESAVWVTVATTRGSTPREAGARMLIDRNHACGTIGGGHLEQCALEHARALLAQHAAGCTPPVRIERFVLGARLGQCCGGVVELAFETVTPATRAWVDRARALHATGSDWLRIATVGDSCVEVWPAAAAPAAARHALGMAGAVLADVAGERLLIDAWRAPTLHVALFGAGHVGRALVEVLGRLPLRVTWIDARDDEFPPQMPHNVRPVVSEQPEAEVRGLPPASAVLIMTHSHALDFELVRAWLERGDFRFLGLIGSRSKRAAFAHRLHARGYDAAGVRRLRCPIGLSGIAGKEPEVIALAIAAQLLSLRADAAAGDGIGDNMHEIADNTANHAARTTGSAPTTT